MKITDLFARLKHICHLPVGRVMDGAGNQSWYFHWKLHRDDGLPAYIGANGKHREFYKFGNLHREGDLPAKELADGGSEYFVQGLRHRDNGPAIIHANGDRMWYQNDKLHRDDGPAVEKGEGGQEWWQSGEKWLQGSAVTPKIQEEKKAAAVEKIVEQATIVDEKVQVLQPIKFRKPGSAPTP